MASKKIKGITIQYEGDTVKLEEALKSVESKGRKAKTEMSEVNRALKEAPDSAVLWQQKQELLNKTLESSKDKLKLLEDAQEEIQRQFDNKSIGEDQYRAFERELERARAETEKLGAEAEDAGKHVEELGGEAGKTSGDLDKMGNTAESSAEGFTVLKGAVAKLAADGLEKLASELKNATEQALEFEGSIAKVSTIADDTVPIEKMKDDIIDLSNETGIAANVIADATYDAISAGQQTGNAVKFVGDATRLARAGFADTGDTLDLLTTILNAYHMEASDTAKVMDVLIQTQNLGKTSVGQLSSAMGKVIPTANAYSVNLEQIAAGYAIMTANGVATSETTTYINSMLNELGKSGTKTSNVLKEETGKSFKELMDEGNTLADVLTIIKDNADKNSLSFGDLWGSAEASKAGLVLLGESADAYNETLKKMESSAGATDIAFEKLETKEYKLEKAQNQMRNSLIEIGSVALESIVPIAEKAMPYIENKLLSFNKNLPAIEKTVSDMLPLIKGVGAAYASWKIASTALKGAEAVKGLATAMHTAEGATKLLNTTMLANPAVAVTAAIVGLTVAIGALVVAQKEETDISAEVAEQFRAEQEAADAAREEIKKMKDDFNDRARDIENESKRTEDLWKELDSLADASGKVKDADKKRAEYILGELNSALGTEYTMTGNQIENYKTLASEIDKVIEKKKAQALVDQYMAMNSAMMRQNAEAQANFEKYDSQYTAARTAETEAERNFRRVTQNWDITAQEYLDAYDWGAGTKEGAEAAQQWLDAKQATMEAGDLRQNAMQAFDSTIDYMHRLDDAEKAFAEERYDDVKDILYTEKNANKEILEDTKNSIDKREEAYKALLKKTYSDIELYSKDWRQKEADAIMQEMKESVNAAQLIGVDASEAFDDTFRGTVQKMLDRDEPFNIDKLCKWARESGLEVGDVFQEDYTKVVQNQLDAGYDITELLLWGIASGEDVGGLFTDEFTKKYQSQLDSGFDVQGLLQWATEKGYELGDVFGSNFSSRYQSYLNDMLYANNDLINEHSINSQWDYEYWKNQGYDFHATGGTIGIGQQGIVAEAGPELLQVMNGGIKITPLSRTATNTPVGAGSGTTINNYNNTVYATVRGKYDVYGMAEDMATAERRIEQGKGR